MNRAIELANEIKRKQQAIAASNSNRLKKDYAKGIIKNKRELKDYCKFKKIDIAEVYNAMR